MGWGGSGVGVMRCTGSAQMDKASVLSDAVMYLEEQKQKIAELEAQVGGMARTRSQVGRGRFGLGPLLRAERHGLGGWGAGRVTRVWWWEGWMRGQRQRLQQLSVRV